LKSETIKTETLKKILAKDSKNNRVLLGGVGHDGLYNRWCDASPYKDHPEYKDAPEKDSRAIYGLYH
jgi:hypothetical protein